MAKKGQKFTKYSTELKIQAVEAYLNGEYGGLMPTAKHFGLKDKSQLRDWIKIYNEYGPESFLVETRGRKSKGKLKSINLDEMTLEQQVEYLKMENDILKKVKALLKD